MLVNDMAFIDAEPGEERDIPRCARPEGLFRTVIFERGDFSDWPKEIRLPRLSMVSRAWYDDNCDTLRFASPATVVTTYALSLRYSHNISPVGLRMDGQAALELLRLYMDNYVLFDMYVDCNGHLRPHGGTFTLWARQTLKPGTLTMNGYTIRDLWMLGRRVTDCNGYSLRSVVGAQASGNRCGRDLLRTAELVRDIDMDILGGRLL